jgi:hypothetical protein
MAEGIGDWGLGIGDWGLGKSRVRWLNNLPQLYFLIPTLFIEGWLRVFTPTYLFNMIDDCLNASPLQTIAN